MSLLRVSLVTYSFQFIASTCTIYLIAFHLEKC